MLPVFSSVFDAAANLILALTVMVALETSMFNHMARTNLQLQETQETLRRMTRRKRRCASHRRMYEDKLRGVKQPL